MSRHVPLILLGLLLIPWIASAQPPLPPQHLPPGETPEQRWAPYDVCNGRVMRNPRGELAGRQRFIGEPNGYFIFEHPSNDRLLAADAQADDYDIYYLRLDDNMGRSIIYDGFATADPIVRQAYVPQIDWMHDTPCPGLWPILSIVYAAPLPSSNKLWVANQNGAAALVGIPASQLAPGTAVNAPIMADATGASGLAFDLNGNAWTAGATTEDAPIVRFSAWSLGESGAQRPDIEISGDVFDGVFPRLSDLTFDPYGNLWAGLPARNSVVMFRHTDIETSGRKNPAITLPGIEGPEALAFDIEGNLWVTSLASGAILFYAMDSLADGAAPTASYHVRTRSLYPGRGGYSRVAHSESERVIVGLRTAPKSLAFDADGNLWVGFDGGIAMLLREALPASGAHEVDAEILLESEVLALPEGMAFDESGGLWVAGIAGALSRYAPEELRNDSQAPPRQTLTHEGFGTLSDVAFFPAPTATPLHSAWQICPRRGSPGYPYFHYRMELPGYSWTGCPARAQFPEGRADQLDREYRGPRHERERWAYP